MNEEKTTITTFQVRLNGLIIPLLKVRPIASDGTTVHWELVACHDKLGEFAMTRTFRYHAGQERAGRR